MEFRVLGPLEVHAGGVPLALGTPKQRCVLALLMLEAGRVVDLETLVDELWPADPPASAVANVRGYAANLRRMFESAEPGRRRLVRHDAGYVLRADPDELDLMAFTAAVAAGRDGLRQQDMKVAVSRFDEALAMWRGPMLADVPQGPQLTVRCAAVREERLAVVEELAGAQSHLDDPEAVVALLREHVLEHPLRERGQLLLMRARYRLGDVTGALATFAEARTALVGRLGIEPGHDMRELHQAILNRGPDPALSAGTQPDARAMPCRQIPAQLPADVWGFTGRGPQLAHLDAVLEAGGRHPTAVVISAIAGTAGVGKTALAVHWAHRVREEFPDGQLYVNLRGYDQSQTPMSPAVAVRGFLDALDVPPKRIPPDLPAQLALYRSLVSHRRMLVVLDNARNADQVRPLLPGAAGCLALVTSRDQLVSLVVANGAHPLTLDLLDVPEARQLLERRVGAHRVAAEPGAVDEIIASCARLPLALAVVAARAATHPHLPLSLLAGELRAAQGGLEMLDGGDAVTDVRAVFSWSYRTLSPRAARLFRLLGLSPGPDIAIPAAASLAGMPVAQVRPVLAELGRAHLIAEHAPGRYAFHDLLRAYATGLAHHEDSGDDRRAALHRLLDHYLHTAHAATRLLHPYQHPIIDLPPLQPGSVPEDPGTKATALAWFMAEHLVLVRALDLAAEAGFDSHAWRLAWSLANYFNRHGHLDHWASTHTVALAAARRLDDREAQAHIHRSLARAHIMLAGYDDAHAHLRHALALYGELGVQVCQAHTHLNIAETLERQSDNRTALDHAQRALALYEAAAHQPGQAYALNAAGWYHAELGDHRQAISYCERALAVQQRLDDRHGQAATWDSLGHVHHLLGDHQQAVTSYHHALVLTRDLGDRYNEGGTLARLGDSWLAAGDADAARDAWQQAYAILDELGQAEAAEISAKLDRLAGAGAGPDQAASP